MLRGSWWRLQDPDARVERDGIARLREAGIAVETGVLADRAARMQQGFLTRVRDGRPMVTLKLASSFDGRIATATGESQWITGPEARRVVHGLRARHDAVLVGGGTARADDPSLTVRGLGEVPQPVRVVWSRRLDLPLNGQLAATARDVPVWICHGPDADADLIRVWRDLGAVLLPVAIGAGRQIDPVAALRAMGAAGLTRVFCEGGGALAASLLAADLVDDLVGFTAGLAIGAEGQPSLGALGVDRLADAPRFCAARDAGGRRGRHACLDPSAPDPGVAGQQSLQFCDRPVERAGTRDVTCDQAVDDDLWRAGPVGDRVVIARIGDQRGMGEGGTGRGRAVRRSGTGPRSRVRPHPA